MGWIYNGTDFIKANKAQLKAYDKYNNFQLGKAALSEPYTIPAIALAGAAAAGVVTVGTLGALFWGPAKGIVDKAVEDLKDLPGEIKDAVIQAIDDAGISTAEQPKFTSDAVRCLQTHPADGGSYSGLGHHHWSWSLLQYTANGGSYSGLSDLYW